MTNRKYNNAIANYTGHKGENTVAAIWAAIPEELKARCTGKELGLVMDAINAAYHAGKASAGAEKIDSDAVWVEGYGVVELDK